MDYMAKREVKRVLKGLNLEIQWAKREIRRSHGNCEKQASLQKYRYLLGLDARACHLKLAFMNGTPYACAERTVRKPLPQFADDVSQMQTWAQPEKMETYSEAEYSYSLAG
jgi:hypothetical protein